MCVYLCVCVHPWQAQHQSTIVGLKSSLEDSKIALAKTEEDAYAKLKVAVQEKKSVAQSSKPVSVTVTRDLLPEEIQAKYGPGDPALKEVLERIAINREVLVAVSNGALVSKDGKYGILATWIESVRASGITNFLVICLDDAVMESMKQVDVPYWRKDPNWGADKAASNHGEKKLAGYFFSCFFFPLFSMSISSLSRLDATSRLISVVATTTTTNETNKQGSALSSFSTFESFSYWATMSFCRTSTSLFSRARSTTFTATRTLRECRTVLTPRRPMEQRKELMIRTWAGRGELLSKARTSACGREELGCSLLFFPDIKYVCVCACVRTCAMRCHAGMLRRFGFLR